MTTDHPHTVCNQIRQIRTRMGYSIGDMGIILGIAKSTFQSYEEGRRQSPPSLVTRMLAVEEADRQWFATRYSPGGEYDQLLSREFPGGIHSEIKGEQY